MAKLMAAFERPLQLAGRELFVSLSAGISLYPNDGDEGELLLRNADTAMFRAKNDGRNRFQFYAPDMNAHSKEKLDLETALRRALQRDEFVLHYQPQLDLRSGRIAGCEALLRWQRTPGGPMAKTTEFVPLLEETGLILPVGEWALRKACAEWRAAQNGSKAPTRISVNVSARQFSDHNLVDNVARVLRDETMHPGTLEIEITESTLMQDVHATREILSGLSALGVRLAIDDFGTGYSSLAYLKRFPIDTLKIDATFIRDLPGDADDAAITQASIALGHQLGLEVVAEGVESRAQLDFLGKHQCDLIQGYVFSHALPAEHAASFVRAHSSTRR